MNTKNCRTASWILVGKSPSKMADLNNMQALATERHIDRALGWGEAPYQRTYLSLYTFFAHTVIRTQTNHHVPPPERHIQRVHFDVLEC